MNAPKSHTPAQDANAGWQPRTLTVEAVMRLAFRLLLGLGAVTLMLYLAAWGLPAWPDAGTLPAVAARRLLEVLVFVAAYAAGAIVHELLHAATMVLVAGVPPRSLRFGLRLSEGVAYVHAPRPMTARAYRIVLAVPGVVLGLAPWAAGLALGHAWLTLYGFVLTVSAAGDLAVGRLLHDLPPDALVRDHPEEVGCLVHM